MDPATNLFKETSNIGRDYKSARDEYIDNGLSLSDAHTLALAYALSSQNTAIMLLQKGTDGTFQTKFVGKGSSKPEGEQFQTKKCH